MILKIIIVIIAIIVLAVIINGIEDYNKQSKNNKLSFSDTMNKLSLPIVSLSNNGRMFNFLLDTGANYSMIHEKALKELRHTNIKGCKGQIYGINGELQEVYYSRIELEHLNEKFVDEFQVLDISSVVDNLKSSDDIEIVGILGSSFLKRYEFIVDFKELAAYKSS